MKKSKLLGILLLAVTIAMVSCDKTKKEEVKKEETTQKMKVKIVQASSALIKQSVDFTATVEPEFKNNIAPSAPGRIRRIFVKVGSSVSKGQKLAQMDDANLSNIETQVENYRRSYNRISGLFSVGGASQQDLDNIKMQLDLAETNLRAMNENTLLISPISGIVTAKNYDEGDMYSAQMPIITVMQINPVKVKINVSESYFTKVKIGMPVDIKLDVYQNESFQGKVSLIYPTIDERSRTFIVEIKLVNNNAKVRPGMFARVNLNFGSENHVVVPDLAIVKQSGSGSRFVYVYNAGKVSLQQITLGIRTGSDFEVLSGLTGNEQIVVSGQSKLVDGSEVEVVK